MPRQVRIGSRARRAFYRELDYLTLHASQATARRFSRAFDSCLKRIADHPHLGSPWESADPHYVTGLRVRALPRFRNHLVFYRVSEDFIDIVHLLHGRQDVERHLQDPT